MENKYQIGDIVRITHEGLRPYEEGLFKIVSIRSIYDTLDYRLDNGYFYDYWNLELVSEEEILLYGR